MSYFGNLAVLSLEHRRHIAVKVGQLGKVVAAIAPDGGNALEPLRGLALRNPFQTILIDADAGDGLDLSKLVHAEGLQQSGACCWRHICCCVYHQPSW